MSRRDTAERLRDVMDEEGDAVSSNTLAINRITDHAVESFEGAEDLRDRARAVKEAAIADLPDLIERTRESVEANDGRVHLARDAEAANATIREIVEGADADLVVKSKSMTTEELEVNDYLARHGVDVFETDLGELIVQVAEEDPSHLIAPALHYTPEEIADLFNERLDPDEPLEADPQQLTEFAREFVGDRIRRAGVGMTGANFVVADTGTIALVTNEGNARKSAVTPDVHVAVAGVEKIVPSVEDLQPFVELIAKSGSGQDITSYVSLLSPPVETPTVDFETGDLGPGEDREFHLVLLDNGRMAMREDDDLRETLYCIRCGACANSCANFQSVGGHAFGGETYTGGIGTGWEAGVHDLGSAAGMNDLCTGCTRCVNRCPVKIDIPWINTVVRDRINHRGAEPGRFEFLVEGLFPDEEPGSLDLTKRVFGNVETLARVGSRFPGLSNRLAQSDAVRGLLDSVVGIDPRRDLPAFADETLREWYGARGTRVENPDREAVLYPDVYTNYFQVGRGKAAVRVLEALDVRVHVPPVPESGRAPLSQGMVETAREHAREVHGDLVGYLDDGYDVVVVEPSDLSMFRRDYEKLLPEASADRLAEHSYEVLEYVYGRLSEGADPDALAGPHRDHPGLTYHPHCQARTLGLDEYTTATLSDAGYDVRTTGAECCGMAGSFGYKSEYYEVSQDVGERLADEVPDDRETVASGASCWEQLTDLLGRGVRHPVEVLDPGR
ncbi:(4Fe-4S)-binding protein [Halobacteriales archaeon QS_8_69_26]|nr:MAG: (4Fe-4S)-binding protein [Halobacteriales archaeon QS_8_69_26]